eukprot:1182769-Prorocentrum_minimum.AAC.2
MKETFANVGWRIFLIVYQLGRRRSFRNQLANSLANKGRACRRQTQRQRRGGTARPASYSARRGQRLTPTSAYPGGASPSPPPAPPRPGVSASCQPGARCRPGAGCQPGAGCRVSAKGSAGS